MTGNNAPKIGGLLLAAGGSSRLGQPKQLVRFEGKTLIRRSGEMLAESVCDPVAVVLGAEIEESRREIEGLDISVCVNVSWNMGISSSIRSGLSHLLGIEPDLDAIVIALCDQPYVTKKNYDHLAKTFGETHLPIVASGYDGVMGVPALFANEIFDQLFLLRGDQGARFLIRQNPEMTVSVAGEGAGFDIDTPQDLRDMIIK